MSHFMSCCQQSPGPGLGAALDPPSSLPSPSLWPQGCPLDKLGLARMPHKKDGTMVSNQIPPPTHTHTHTHIKKAYAP